MLRILVSSLVVYVHIVIFFLEMFCALEVTNLHYWRITVSALLTARHQFNMAAIMLLVENRPPHHYKPAHPGKNQVTKLCLCL